MNVQRYLQARNQTAVMLLALGFVVLLGVLDYWTGPFAFSIFYLIPVSLAAWFAGKRAGVGFAIVSTVVWFGNDVLRPLVSLPFAVQIWNAAVRLGFFLVVALLLAKLKALYVSLEQRVAERTASLTAEIAERHRLEAAAKLHFAQLASDKMWDAAYWIRPDGRFAHVNDAACRQLGYSRAELLALNITDLDPDMSPELWAQGWREIRIVKHRTFTARHRAKNGRVFSVELTVSHLQADGDEYHFSIARDLTVREQADRALHASEARLRLALQASNAGTWSWDVARNVASWDECYHQQYGFAPNDAVSFEAWVARVHPQDREQLLVEIRQLIEPGSGDNWNQEFRALLPGPGERWMWGLGHIERDATGRAVRFAGINLDITDRKRMEQVVRTSEMRLKMFGEATFEGIVESEAGRILDCNEQFARISGYTVAELKGLEIVSLVVPADRDRVLENIRLNRDAVTEHAMLRKDGTRIIVETHGRPMSSNSAVRHTALRDVTRRKRAEAALQESEERYRTLFAQAADAIVVFDPQTLEFLEFNEEACRRLGYTREEFSQLKIPDLDVLEDANAVRHHVQSIPADTVIEFETRHRTKTGTVLDIVVRTRRIHTGSTMLVQAIWTDVTERNRVQAALREQQAKLELAVTGSKGIPWEVPVDLAQPEQFRDTALGNPRLKEFIGFRDGELPNTVAEWFDRIHPDDVARLQDSARDHLAGRVTAPNIEYRIRHKDGSWRWISSQRQLFHDPHGRPVRWSGIDWDITERKRMETELAQLVQERTQALAESRQLFHNIFDSCTDAIGYADLEGKLINANPAFMTLTGYTLPELQQLTFQQITPPEYTETDQHTRETILRTGQTQRFEKEYIRKDGTRVPVAVTVFTVRNSAGQLTGTAVSVRDITDQRRLQRQLLEISDAEQNRIGRDLHDSLCQILTGITFGLGALEERLAPRDGTAAQDVHGISELVRRANAEARNIAHGLNPVELETGGLLAALQQLADVITRAGLIRCELLVPPSLPALDNACALHVYRIAQEAVANALRHGHATQIVIELTITGQQIQLQVTNNGGRWSLEPVSPYGSGLRLMAYRARMVNGTLQVCPFATGGGMVTLNFQGQLK